MATTQTTPFQLPASLGVIATKLNPEFIEDQRDITFLAAADQAATDFSDDPQVGHVLPGCSFKAEDVTSVQYEIWRISTEGGLVPPDNLNDIMVANPGPDAFWNWQLGAGGWGLGGTTPSAGLQVVNIFDPRSRTQINRVFVVPAAA